MRRPVQLAAGLALLLAGSTATAAAEGSPQTIDAADLRPRGADHLFVDHPTNQALRLLSQGSVEVIGSLVVSFLGKEGLDRGKLQCMVSSSEKFASDVMEMCSNLIMMLQSGLGMKGGLRDMPQNTFEKPMPVIRFETGEPHREEVDRPQNLTEEVIKLKADLAEAVRQEHYMRAAHLKRQVEAVEAAIALKESSAKNTSESLDMFYHSRRLTGHGDVSKAMSSGALLMKASAVFIDVGVTMQEIVRLANHIGEDCLQGDTLRALETAGRHMRDIRYVGGHFLANGADVVNELSDSVVAWKERNFTRFGADVGTALRKVFLSRDNSTMPEAVLSKEVMTTVSQGIVRGFFGKGFELNVKLDKDPLDPLHIDIEACIANNMVFFREVYASLMYLYSQQVEAAAEKEHMVATSPQAEGQDHNEKARFGTAVALVMMQLPDALMKCGLGKDQADMLVSSIKNFGDGMQLMIKTPNVAPTKQTMVDNLQKTLKDWSEFNWYQWGYDVGLLLQELLLAIFPQEYSFDENGVLIRQVVALGARGPLASRLAAGGSMLLVVPALLAAVVAAARRARCRGTDAREAPADMEELGRAPSSLLAPE